MREASMWAISPVAILACRHASTVRLKIGAGGCCAAGFQSRHCRLGVRPGRTQTAHIESASTPRADMKRTFRIGSFVPNSDIGQIIDHLVGAREQASAGLQGRQLTPWAIDEQLE